MFAIQDMLEISFAHKAIDHIRNLPLALWFARGQHDISGYTKRSLPIMYSPNYVAASRVWPEDM